jgi:alpha-glucosidase
VEGGSEKWVVADIDKIPLFIKEGAIIPKYPVQQYVGELKIEQLTLNVYYKLGTEQSTIYEDDQDGYDYKKGGFSLRNFKFQGKEKEIIIQQFKDGDFITSYENFKVNLIGLPFRIDKVLVDNEKVNLKDVRLNGDNTIEISKNFTQLQIIGK